MDWFDMNIFGYGLNMSMDWFTACSPIEFPWVIFRVSGEDFPLNQYIDKLGCSWMFEQVEMNVFSMKLKICLIRYRITPQIHWLLSMFPSFPSWQLSRGEIQAGPSRGGKLLL